MACSKSADYLANETRIVLVGKTGAGKSALGNTIVGRKEFNSVPFGKSQTLHCSHATLKRFGHNLQVVDVPGFKDTCKKENDLHKSISECVTLLSPGMHAILYVVRIGRYTEEDAKTVEDFISLFGEPSRNFVIVVFTGEDDLDDIPLETFIEQSPVSLKQFLREVNNRFISVNNKASNPEKERFVQRLLDKIEQMLRDNNRSFYGSDMFAKAEVFIKTLEEEKLKEIESNNREEDERMIERVIEEYKAELAKQNVPKENQPALIQTMKQEQIVQIVNENKREARDETRNTMMETIATTAVAGAAGGALLGPVGVAVGGVLGATVGAFKNIFFSW